MAIPARISSQDLIKEISAGLAVILPSTYLRNIRYAPERRAIEIQVMDPVACREVGYSILEDLLERADADTRVSIVGDCARRMVKTLKVGDRKEQQAERLNQLSASVLSGLHGGASTPAAAPDPATSKRAFGTQQREGLLVMSTPKSASPVWSDLGRAGRLPPWRTEAPPQAQTSSQVNVPAEQARLEAELYQRLLQDRRLYLSDCDLSIVDHGPAAGRL